MDKLDAFHQQKVRANIDNYKVQREALSLIQSGKMTDEKMGELLNRHQKNLRDGLQISTPTLDKILAKALETGAYGGKFNGSGGGGCLYCYAPKDKAEAILAAVKEMGYPGMILTQDKGLTVCD